MASSEKVLVVNLNDSPDYQKLLNSEEQSRGMRAGRVYLQPGKACGQHTTGPHEELLVFLSGQGELLAGENDSFEVGKGKVSYIPPSTVHNVKNTGTEPLIYVYCVAPVSGQIRK